MAKQHLLPSLHLLQQVLTKFNLILTAYPIGFRLFPPVYLLLLFRIYVFLVQN